MIKVQSQGNLDGLCGVYSVINAVRHLSSRRLTNEQTRRLFGDLCGKLMQEERLLSAVCDGIRFEVLERLIDKASQFLDADGYGKLKRERAFSKGLVKRRVFWDRLSEHIKGHGAGSVILLLDGKHDHWTCVESINENSILLIDSSGLRRISRKSCTIAKEREGRHHILDPKQTYLLTKVD